jgi:hypothetical protein
MWYKYDLSEYVLTYAHIIQPKNHKINPKYMIYSIKLFKNEVMGLVPKKSRNLGGWDWYSQNTFKCDNMASYI